MKEEQLKLLAEMTIANCVCLSKVGDGLVRVVEEIRLKFPEEPGLILLLSEVEQTQAVLRDLRSSLESNRRELGLDSSS